MAKFEIVSLYADQGIKLPIRKTAKSAGYDIAAAEDIIVPSYPAGIDLPAPFSQSTLNLKGIEAWSKTMFRPTLIPTGIKCKLEDDEYLELSVRSSTPLKYWLILANGVGIIDADYWNNSSNEGHIYLQVINLSPFDIHIKKGDMIGQGIIHNYKTVENDNAIGERTGGFGSTTKAE